MDNLVTSRGIEPPPYIKRVPGGEKERRSKSRVQGVSPVTRGPVEKRKGPDLVHDRQDGPKNSENQTSFLSRIEGNTRDRKRSRGS